MKLANVLCLLGGEWRSFGKIASVRNLAIVYFADESFQNPEQADRLLAAPIAASSEFGERATSGELTVALGDRESGASRPLLNTTEELHYFRQYNYLKYRAAALQEEVLSCLGCAAMLADLEALLYCSVRIRNLLVEANMRLVISLANKYSGGSATKRDDLLSVGGEALLSAVEKFDYRRGFRFSTYAYAAIQRSIFGALRREHRQQRGLVADGHELTASAIRNASSADRQCLEVAEARHEVQRLLQALEPREREILMLRFGFGADSQPVSFQAIAQQIGLSKQRVASLYQEIMAKLRSRIGLAAA